jgi:hypothetical protein
MPETPACLPTNEPYHGRPLLAELDTVMAATVEENGNAASRSHAAAPLNEFQQMACQVLPQAISIALSIRELIRVGHLFSGHMLVRPLMERCVTLLYLLWNPDKIEVWNRGWHFPEAPSLNTMMKVIQKRIMPGDSTPPSFLTASLNALLHGKPEAALSNMIQLEGNRYVYANSSILNRPDLCDSLCEDVAPWLELLQCLMLAYFPENTPDRDR